MKQTLIIISIIISILVYTNKTEKNIIPDNSIRIRVIANSNNIEDQLTKLKVKEKVVEELSKKITNNTNLETVKQEIINDIPNIEKIVSNYATNYNVEYGNNYFPEKTFKGFTYKSGNYESLVISLGQGTGENWWCVLFPPLCTIDIKSEKDEKIEYKSKVLEILNQYN